MPSSIVHCLLGPTCPPGSPYSTCRATLSVLDDLVDEVDAEEMQDQAADDVVGKCSVVELDKIPRQSIRVANLSGDTEGNSVLLDWLV